MSTSPLQRAPFAAYLLARRRKLGLTMREVAGRCDKRTSWYDTIEAGARRSLSREDVALLEKALELPEGAVEKQARAAGL